MGIHTSKKVSDDLSIREKLAIRFLMIIVQILAPWEYEHQFDAMWADIKRQLGIKDKYDE